MYYIYNYSFEKTIKKTLMYTIEQNQCNNKHFIYVKCHHVNNICFKQGTKLRRSKADAVSMKG